MSPFLALIIIKLNFKNMEAPHLSLLRARSKSSNSLNDYTERDEFKKKKRIRNDKHQRCESDFKVRNRSGEKTNRHKDYSTKLQYDNYKTREQMIKMCHEDLKLTLISFQKDLISSSGIKLGKDYNSKPLFSGTYTSKGKDTKSILDPHPTLSFNNYSQINSVALYPSIPPSPKPTLPSSSKTPTSEFSSVISRLATLYTK